MAKANLSSFSFAILAFLLCFVIYTDATRSMMSIPDEHLNGERKFWCKANASASEVDLKSMLDKICFFPNVNCGEVRSGGACFLPDTTFNHASYVFNLYYRYKDSNAATCEFNNLGEITETDPSYGSCIFP